MTSSLRQINVTDAYDYRVAMPLAMVAILALLFVSIDGHKPLLLKSTSASSSSSKNLVSHEATPVIKAAGQLPALSPNVNSIDLSPNEAPTDIQTFSPQNSLASGSSASNGSAKALQNPNTSSFSANNQPLQTDIQNLINGVPGAINGINLKSD